MAEAVSEGLTGERPTDGANGFLMYSILRCQIDTFPYLFLRDELKQNVTVIS